MSPAEDDETASPLRAIIDAIPTLVWSADADGAVELVNRRWLQYTGLSEAQTTGWGWVAAVHPDDRDCIVGRWRSLVKTGEPGETEARLRRFDGEYRWFLSRADPVRDASGAVARWCGSNTDIDDRKRLEDALGASERSLRSILDSVPGFVGILDPTGKIEWVNKSAIDYFGRSVEQLRGWWAKDTVHPDDIPHMVGIVGSSLASGEPMEAEGRLRRADGIYRWFLFRSRPMRDSADHIVRWCAVVTDIHDRKMAEATLLEAQAQLSRAAKIATAAELAASIAHEVNQPLAAIVTNGHACLRWLAAEQANLDKAREAAERIVRDGRDAGAVVSKVRSLFKRAEIERVAFDVNIVIKEVLCMLEMDASRRRVIVETALDPELLPVLGDRVQLQQVLYNLAINALEALDGVFDRPKKVLVRSARRNHATAIVTVRDNGLGLNDTDKIFEPFFTTKKNAMGMGLAICHSIVDAHDGTLWAARNEGPGSVFFFTLPLTDE